MSKNIVYDFLKQNESKSFSADEIAKQCKVRLQTAYSNIKKLEKDGLITVSTITGRDFASYRVFSINVVDDGFNQIKVLVDNKRKEYEFLNRGDILSMLILKKLDAILDQSKSKERFKSL